MGDPARLVVVAARTVAGPVTLAIPAFALFLILEWVAARALERAEPGTDGRVRPPRGGYEMRDARASLSMGLISIVTSAGWKILALVGYSALWVYVAPCICPPMPGTRG